MSNIDPKLYQFWTPLMAFLITGACWHIAGIARAFLEAIVLVRDLIAA